MKTALLLLLLISVNTVFAQAYPDSNSYCNFQPYYDYELCAKGLKDTNGTIILEPRYSEISLLPGDLLLVCENEQYGVLNCQFEVVIPLQYKQLRWMAKYYYQAQHELNYYWLFETETGKGLMNSSQEKVIPPINEHIARVNLEKQPTEHTFSFGSQYMKTARFFRVTSDGKDAIYNDKGDIIVPNIYNRITCHTIHDPASTPLLPNGIFFHAQNDSIQVVLSEKGEPLFQESVNTQMFVFSLDSTTIIRTMYKDGMSQAICLETGAKTNKNFSSILNSYFLMFDVNSDQTFDAYGKNLKPIYHGKEWRAPAHLQKIEDDSLLVLYSNDGSTTVFSQKGDVIIQSHNDVFVSEGEFGGCIWTVSKLSEKDEDTLRIYRPNGEPKQEFILNEIGSTESFKKQHWDDDRNESDPLLFIRKGKKWGALDRKGDLVFPFKFDQPGISFRTEHDDRSSFKQGTVAGYYLTRSGKIGAVDRSSNYVYPCKYDTTFSAPIYTIQRNYNSFHVVDKP